MKFTKLFENLIYTEPNQVKLTVTSDLTFLTEERRKDIKEMYSHSHPSIRMTASFMNALYTQKKTTFLFSRKICQELLSGDSRSTRSTMSGDDQSEFMAFLLKNKIVRVLRESSNQAGPGAKSSVVEIIEPNIISEIETLVGRQYLSVQKEATLKFYDDFEVMRLKKEAKRELKKSTSTETSTDTDNVSVSDPRLSIPEAAASEPAQLGDAKKSFKAKKKKTNVSKPLLTYTLASLHQKIDFLVCNNDPYSSKLLGIKAHMDKFDEASQKQQSFVVGRYEKVQNANIKAHWAKVKADRLKDNSGNV